MTALDAAPAFSIGAHIREALRERTTDDLDELAAEIVAGITFENWRESALPLVRQALPLYMGGGRSGIRRAGRAKRDQAVADLRRRAVENALAALAILAECDRLDALADATERAKKKTPR